MKKYVAILRGINVGGHRKILMADLKKLLKSSGLQNVVTYIQSGNVALESDLSSTKVESLIANSIKEKYGFDVPVIVRVQDELDSIVNNNPFLAEVGEEIERLYVVFFAEKPKKENVIEFNQLIFGEDEFLVENNHAFLKYKTKASQSKMTHTIFEKKLKVVCSARNWRTVLKLTEMAKKF